MVSFALDILVLLLLLYGPESQISVSFSLFFQLLVFFQKLFLSCFLQLRFKRLLFSQILVFSNFCLFFCLFKRSFGFDFIGFGFTIKGLFLLSSKFLYFLLFFIAQQLYLPNPRFFSFYLLKIVLRYLLLYSYFLLSLLLFKSYRFFIASFNFQYHLLHSLLFLLLLLNLNSLHLFDVFQELCPLHLPYFFLLNAFSVSLFDLVDNFYRALMNSNLP